MQSVFVSLYVSFLKFILPQSHVLVNIQCELSPLVNVFSSKKWSFLPFVIIRWCVLWQHSESRTCTHLYSCLICPLSIITSLRSFLVPYSSLYYQHSSKYQHTGICWSDTSLTLTFCIGRSRGAIDRNIWHSPVRHGLPIYPEVLRLPCPLGYPDWSLDYSAALIIVIPQMAICSAQVGELAPGRSTQLPCIFKLGQLHHCSLIAHDGLATVYEPSVISSSLWLKILD